MVWCHNHRAIARNSFSALKLNPKVDATDAVDQVSQKMVEEQLFNPATQFFALENGILTQPQIDGSASMSARRRGLEDAGLAPTLPAQLDSRSRHQIPSSFGSRVAITLRPAYGDRTCRLLMS